MSLDKAEISELVLANRLKLTDFVFDELTFEEKEMIFSAGRDFGFELKEKDEFFQVKPVIDSKKEYQAVIFITGNYSVKSRYLLQTNEGAVTIEVFLYHQDRVKFRVRQIAKKLINKKLVKLYPGCDEEYLYEVLLESSDSFLFERLKKIAKDLPIYQLSFETDGGFEIKEMGIV
ncbi:hypothetical protein COY89_03125 [Candidatus Roizmanbacteria bacterium CG_4_10_14_0_8_um_filter_36_36]|uniref:Uncharacterized protein n=1 Tax=Candidatus Roizmanbacteria bacterium CG_4_8_14_3_um_filter_36_10 TaxID=1974834 RepID=A0A2M8GNB7_9BACT|nr:MAG: hypothetical protein COY89_03125 [Candidatus Roizmanbacteria bacterium CG_4_10_14_0_8_um_filter_36_36]PJA52671.1 MAG: hypothetical protein CO166_04675 [Candidatus Roizmanbacteria bacterium CG_4_9_14_3_um_filter_36_11]PJC82033.1 MAG: hypothetical protein CO007_01665 [Candidatus Roizmanbacteria bacterium CG_4_8_14_3_um_filter_36_10]